MRRLPIQELAMRPLELKELGDDGCLVLFDNVDALPCKELEEAVRHAMPVIATKGCHARCSMLIVSYSPTNGIKSRVLLSEMHAFVCYAHSAKCHVHQVFTGKIRRYGKGPSYRCQEITLSVVHV